MTDDEILSLMKRIDPQVVRLPPGIKKIAVAIMAAEREACAKVCEDIDARCPECAGHNDHDQCVVPAPWQYAAAIRMRSQVEAENLNKGTI